MKKMDQKLSKILEILEGCEKEGRLYWLGVMIRWGWVSEGEGGYIVRKLGL